MAPIDASCADRGPPTSGGTPYLRTHPAQTHTPQSQLRPATRHRRNQTTPQPSRDKIGDQDPWSAHRPPVGVATAHPSNLGHLPVGQCRGVTRSTGTGCASSAASGAASEMPSGFDAVAADVAGLPPRGRPATRPVARPDQAEQAERRPLPDAQAPGDAPGPVRATGWLSSEHSIPSKLGGWDDLVEVGDFRQGEHAIGGVAGGSRRGLALRWCRCRGWLVCWHSTSTAMQEGCPVMRNVAVSSRIVAVLFAAVLVAGFGEVSTGGRLRPRRPRALERICRPSTSRSTRCPIAPT